MHGWMVDDDDGARRAKRGHTAREAHRGAAVRGVVGKRGTTTTRIDIHSFHFIREGPSGNIANAVAESIQS